MTHSRFRTQNTFYEVLIPWYERSFRLIEAKIVPLQAENPKLETFTKTSVLLTNVDVSPIYQK